MTKSIHGYKMQDLYNMIGISKQGFYKKLNELERKEKINCNIITLAKELRKDHRRMGCRKMYYELQSFGMGRDKVEQLLLSNGFRVPRRRNFTRTTYAGDRFYNNLISGMKVKDKNQLWVSDITYIPVGYKKNYYLTLILDVYTKRITGWSLSRTLLTEETIIPAFREAIKELSEKERKGLILHSDKGSQYGSEVMRLMYENTKIQPSMGGKAWENAHAESVNGIIKNEYVNIEQTEISLKEATKLMEKWIYLYNNKRPHGSIKNMKPNEYETYLEQISVQDKQTITINY